MVFEDGASLRDGLQALADADGRPAPRAAAKVAFAFAGQESRWSGMVTSLYETEPVVRAVLDRCDTELRQEEGASLLEEILGAGAGDAAPTPAALYALECALTALWSSVGVRPGVVVGHGLGELAAAQAAGVFGLEEGLRLAAALGEEGGPASPDGPEAAFDSIALAPPAISLVSGGTGRVLTADELDGAHWHRQAHGPAAVDRWAGTLAGQGVQVVVEIGPDAVLGPTVAAAWPGSADGPGAPAVLSSLRRDSEPCAGFAAAVAGAYEAGLAVSFAGLFSGEARRRVSLPGYPFQRRRHWVRAPGPSAPGPGA